MQALLEYEKHKRQIGELQLPVGSLPHSNISDKEVEFDCVLLFFNEVWEGCMKLFCCILFLYIEPPNLPISPGVFLFVLHSSSVIWSYWTSFCSQMVSILQDQVGQEEMLQLVLCRVGMLSVLLDMARFRSLLSRFVELL